MNFVSLQYAVFLCAILFVYWRMGRSQQHLLLLVASYGFYACWNWQFLSLILISSLTDFIVGAKIYRAQTPTARRNWLIVTLIINFSILGYFKYANFFIDSARDLLHGLGFDSHFGSLDILLPVGISFYTFQSISYSIDIYRRELTPTHRLIDFLMFVAFFPQLVAGPIVRAREFLFQMSTPRVFAWNNMQTGVQLILTGLVKKAVIADTLAIHLVDPIFAQPEQFATSTLWLGAIAYAVQIYCDFSGYSNIAIGSALLFGFHLPENFRFPYLAKNFSDFWTRWHITMSRFFRDYVYIPLGGNRRGPTRNLLNLASTTVVSGLWHGAAWTFVLWGIVHGLLLIGQRTLALRLRSIAPLIVKFVLFQVLLVLTWVLFRAGTIALAFDYIMALFTFQNGESIETSALIWFCFGLFVIDHLYGLHPQRVEQWLEPMSRRAIYWISLILILFHFKPEGAAPFIYFQF